MVEHLPSVLEALSLEPSTIVKERQRHSSTKLNMHPLSWFLFRKLTNSGSLALSVSRRQVCCCLAYQLFANLCPAGMVKFGCIEGVENQYSPVQAIPPFLPQPSPVLSMAV